MRPTSVFEAPNGKAIVDSVAGVSSPRSEIRYLYEKIALENKGLFFSEDFIEHFFGIRPPFIPYETLKGQIYSGDEVSARYYDEDVAKFYESSQNFEEWSREHASHVKKYFERNESLWRVAAEDANALDKLLMERNMLYEIIKDKDEHYANLSALVFGLILTVASGFMWRSAGATLLFSVAIFPILIFIGEGFCVLVNAINHIVHWKKMRRYKEVKEEINKIKGSTLEKLFTPIPEETKPVEIEQATPRSEQKEVEAVKDVTKLNEPMTFVIEQAKLENMESKSEAKENLKWLVGFTKANKEKLTIVISDIQNGWYNKTAKELKEIANVRTSMPNVRENEPVFYFGNAEGKKFAEAVAGIKGADKLVGVDLATGEGFALATLLGKKIEELPEVNGYHKDVQEFYSADIANAIQVFFETYVVISSAAQRTRTRKGGEDFFLSAFLF